MHLTILLFTVLLALGISPELLAAVTAETAGSGSDVQTPPATQLDGLLPLMIVMTSIVTAWCMNYAAPKTRAIGTALASVGCLAVAVWFFFFVTGSGILENPKPNQTPMDSAKPALLWVQGSAALAAGLLLLVTALRQGRSTRELTLGAANESQRYGRVSRIFHWTMAALFIVIVPMGVFASIIPEDAAFRRIYYTIHETLGVLVLVLAAGRILWNRRSRRPALDTALKPMERKMAHGAHVALYGLMLALPVTGFVMTTYVGAPTLFFAWELPPLWGPGNGLVWGLLHKYILPYILYIVWGSHILGALKHRYIDGHENAFRRMVS